MTAKKTFKQTVVKHPTFRSLLTPYDGYHSAGPRVRPDGRLVIDILKSKTDFIGGMLYARYLLEVTLGRKLKPGHEVDHIDGCNWHDRIGNLQEVQNIVNARKGTSDILRNIQHAKTYIQVQCPFCGRWFEKMKTMMLGKLTFCSRTCMGKYYHSTEPHACDTVIMRPISTPDLSSLPDRYSEPFEKYSTDYYTMVNVAVCKCGNPLSQHSKQYCDECLKKKSEQRQVQDAELLSNFSKLVIEMYQAEGKVVMSRISPALGYTDKGLAKAIKRLYGKPHKEVIADICGSI